MPPDALQEAAGERDVGLDVAPWPDGEDEDGHELGRSRLIIDPGLPGRGR